MESINSKMLNLADELNFYFQNKRKEDSELALRKISSYFPNLSIADSKSIIDLLEIQWKNVKKSNKSFEVVVTLPHIILEELLVCFESI